MLEIKEAQKQVKEFEEKRGWENNKDLKDIGLNIAEEVGEIVRELSKKQKGYRRKFDKEKLGEELSDIITRTMIIAEDNDIDLPKSIIQKFNQIKQRFEVVQ